MDSIFRRVAMERLSSPEQLDQLLRVTTLRAWLALAALGAVLVAAIVWGFYGSIPTRVAGRGVILALGGLQEIAALGSGRVTAVSVTQGQEIKAGDLVAKVAQPDLEDQVRELETDLRQLTIQKQVTMEYGKENLKLFYQSLEQQRQTIEKDMKADRKRLAVLAKRIKNQEALLKDGLITQANLLDTISLRDQTLLTLSKNRDKLKDLLVQKAEKEKDFEQSRVQIDEKINDKQAQVSSAKNQLKLKGRVTSPLAGRVYEVRISPGQVVSQGQVLLTLEVTDKKSKDLGAYVFFPAAGMGKAVQAKMEAQVVPSTVKQEEYGYIQGEVVWVSTYPASAAGMNRLLKNDELVKELSQSGAQLEVGVKLIKDPKAFSGFEWSSSYGPKVKVTSGTVVAATVTLRKQPPIELVIPLFKKYILGVGEGQGKP